MAARKSDVIVEAARQLFLERGYDGTSMDDVAATSGASKTTVYNNFEDKEKLFTGVIMQVTERASQIAEVEQEVYSDRPLDERLQRVAKRLARDVLDPSVIQLRRLAIAEALRFPELGKTYWDVGPGRTVEILQTAFAEIDAAGDLDIPDPHAAALQFAYAVLGPFQDLALLRPGDTVDQAEVQRHAGLTAEGFVRAHAPRTAKGRGKTRAKGTAGSRSRRTGTG